MNMSRDITLVRYQDLFFIVRYLSGSRCFNLHRSFNLWPRSMLGRSWDHEENTVLWVTQLIEILCVFHLTLLYISCFYIGWNVPQSDISPMVTRDEM